MWRLKYNTDLCLLKCSLGRCTDVCVLCSQWLSRPSLSTTRCMKQPNEVQIQPLPCLIYLLNVFCDIDLCCNTFTPTRLCHGGDSQSSFGPVNIFFPFLLTPFDSVCTLCVYGTYLCVWTGNLSWLRECMENKVGINGLDKAGNTALYWGCHGGHKGNISDSRKYTNHLVVQFSFI